MNEAKLRQVWAPYTPPTPTLSQAELAVPQGTLALGEWDDWENILTHLYKKDGNLHLVQFNNAFDILSHIENESLSVKSISLRLGKVYSRFTSFEFALLMRDKCYGHDCSLNLLGIEAAPSSYEPTGAPFIAPTA